jgi:hypothetical protein
MTIYVFTTSYRLTISCFISTTEGSELRCRFLGLGCSIWYPLGFTMGDGESGLADSPPRWMIRNKHQTNFLASIHLQGRAKEHCDKRDSRSYRILCSGLQP